MLYYRCDASLPEQLPPELVGWASASSDYALHRNDVGLHRVVAICPPFQFDPTAPTKWRKLAGTDWEVAKHGEHAPMAAIKLLAPWKVSVVTISGTPWILPSVLGPTGARDFAVVYDENFAPELTDEQTRAVQIATEIRVCHETQNWPEMAIQAHWAAWLLTLTYAYSVDTVMLQRLLNDDVIRTTCLVAGGLHDAESA